MPTGIHRKVLVVATCSPNCRRDAPGPEELWGDHRLQPGAPLGGDERLRSLAFRLPGLRSDGPHRAAALAGGITDPNTRALAFAALVTEATRRGDEPARPLPPRSRPATRTSPVGWQQPRWPQAREIADPARRASALCDLAVTPVAVAPEAAAAAAESAPAADPATPTADGEPSAGPARHRAC